MHCSKFHSPILALLLCFAFIASAPAQEFYPGFGSQPTSTTLQPAENMEGAPLNVKELATHPLLSSTIDLTAPTEDLWQRLRNGFSMPGLNNELVLKHQQWYLSHPEYLRRVVERSRPYIHHIVEELEKRGMPNELALLPVVESAFNPTANSPARASGLWQFIPSTGKRFELKQNWWHDERRDIVASTEAALEYLQTIYEMHGDWHLALASYNWGEGAVQRAIQKNAAKGLPTDYSSLTMPEETRQYVPKLIALKNIFSSADTLAELRIPVVPNRAYFATISPKKPIDVRLAAQFAGMSVDEFVKLNPAHNRPVISPQSTLIIPADRLQSFQSKMDSHNAPLSSWQLYTTKSAERLDKLAPRFGISLADLKRVNSIKGGIRLAAGTSVLVPANGGEGLRVMPEQIRAPEALPEREARGKHGRNGKKAGKGRNGKPSVAKAGKSVRHSAVAKGGKKAAPAKNVRPAAKSNGKKTTAKPAAKKPAKRR
ncbi:MAG: Lytic transglycosylase catalytic [Proteobacteria bacterium]|nr:Lytic transglycosylase catalytic [Pseudomonadota bacterium]